MAITTKHDSSNIHSSTYDEQSKKLTVTFLRNGAPGDSYQYSDVPADVYANFVNAESTGKYFAANMKNKYPTKKTMTQELMPVLNYWTAERELWFATSCPEHMDKARQLDKPPVGYELGNCVICGKDLSPIPPETKER